MNTTKKTTLTELVAASKHFFVLREEIKFAISNLNPVEIVTPINVTEEKKKWIENAKKGIFGNPKFKYDTELLNRTIMARPLLKALMDDLTEKRPNRDNVADDFIWEQLWFALNDGIGTTFLAEAIRDGKDSDAADVIVSKYGLPSEKNIGFALNVILDNHAKDSLEHVVDKKYALSEEDKIALTERELDAETIREMFEWTMSDYIAKAWPVIITDECTSIDVRDKSKYGHPVIVIPTSRKVTGMKLAELIGHEIECHWRSSVNAELIGALKCDDELIYEGLAALKDKTFNRDYSGTFNLNSAYYIIAINEAARGTCFADIAKTIYNYLPDSTKNKEAKAWLYTYRAMRGITDTENPSGYAFTKDRAYFEGWLYAKMLEIHGKTSYLSFSTLNQKSFERLMEIVDIEDIEASAFMDRDVQSRSIEKLLKNSSYLGTQAEKLAIMCN